MSTEANKAIVYRYAEPLGSTGNLELQQIGTACPGMENNMTSENTPRKPDEISVSWLNTMLADQLAGGASILSFDTEVIGEGVGILGEILRLSLHYDRPTDAPQSLIAKFATPNLEARELARTFRFYENEVHFYLELDADSPVRTPTCYLAYNNPETQDTLLLLQDLSADAMVDQIQGCSLDRAELVVEELAKLHGYWWEHPRLGELSWISRLDNPLYTENVPEHYRSSVPVTLERLGDAIADWYPKIQEKFGNNLPDILRRMDQFPLTLVHGDFRLDNLMFGSHNGQPMLTVIDWQIIIHAPSIYDLAYFLSQSLTVEDRRANEKELLSLYYDRLRQQGVQNTSPEQLYEIYRLVCLYCLIYPIISGAVIDMDSPRAVELIHCIAERAFTAIEDHNALELLS
jgi:thiamine kinase-like enzyme